MANILVVEDKRLIAGLLEEIEGYDIVTVLCGTEAIHFTLRETPHLVLLNMRLSDTDGYEVIRQLRAHPKSLHIPIIAVGSCDNCDCADRVRAFELGVDDYVTQPFDPNEFRARVRTQLRRVRQSFLSPLIGLPGGYQVELAIKRKLTGNEPWSILYLDLDNFKAFNDAYGFLTGNDLIRLVGRICQRVVREHGNPDDFVGHIGGDDYVILTTPELAHTLCRMICTSYKLESRALYNPEDLRRGAINGTGRTGKENVFPLVSLSIGVVNNQVRRSHTLKEVSYLAAEAKCQAKQSTDNVYYISPSLEYETFNQNIRVSALSASGRYLFAQPLPPSLAQFTVDHLRHEPDIIRLMDKKNLVEREQKVY